LRWPYFLPPINDQYNQENWPYMCNIPILQRSYSMWPLKHNNTCFHPSYYAWLQVDMRDKCDIMWLYTCFIYLFKTFKKFRTIPMHRTSSEYGGPSDNISKHPWCPHTSNTSQPNYSPQIQNTPNDHFHQISIIKQTIGDYLNTNIFSRTIAKRMANRSKFIMNNPPNNIG
jgi:hypothetical protein